MVFLTLTACGGTDADTDESSDTEASAQVSASTSAGNTDDVKTEEPKKDPYEALGFEGVDVTVSGTVKKDAPSVSSSEISLFGKSLQMNFLLSDLTSDGWSTDDCDVMSRTVAALTKMGYHDDIDMKKNGINYMDIRKLLNDSETEAIQNDCRVWQFTIFNIADADFVLPGGITQDSTLRDILDVYGYPENCKNFYGCTVYQNKLQYGQCYGSGLYYTFEFTANGDISSVRIMSK